MNIGYARVSIDEQNLALQKDALEKAGCELIFEDQLSEAKARRPGLEKALSRLRSGDTFSCLVACPTEAMSLQASV